MFTAAVIVAMAALIFALPTPDGDVAQGRPPAQVLIANVQTLGADGLTGPRWIRLADGHIAEISEETLPEDDAQVIDGSGLTALPGLIDAHTHSYGSALDDALRFGVTAQLDMFSDSARLMEWRAARENSGPTSSTDLFSAGTMATAPGGHGTQYGMAIPTLTGPAQAPDWVAARKADGSDFIKLVYMPGLASLPSLSRDTAAAVIDAAHAQGLMAVAHIATEAAAIEMMEDGIDGLVHIYADVPASDAAIALAVERNVFIIPTLSVIAAIDGQGEAFADSLSDTLRERLSPMQAQTLGVSFPGYVGFDYETALGNIRRFHDAGVAILAGSDAPNPGTAHGISLHGELEHLVRAGLTPREALAAASDLPASRFGLDGRGELLPGARADLIMIGGDPTEDISATRDLRHVIKNGRSVAMDRPTGGAAQALDNGDIAPLGANGLTVDGRLAWSVTTDAMAGGVSEATIAFADGRIDVSGTVSRGFPFPWSGAGLNPVAQAQTLDLSGFETIEFTAAGTPGIYRVTAFQQNGGAIPPTQTFRVGESPQRVSLALAASDGFDPSEWAGFAIVAGPETGSYTLSLLELALR